MLSSKTADPIDILSGDVYGSETDKKKERKKQRKKERKRETAKQTVTTKRRSVAKSNSYDHRFSEAHTEDW